MKLFGDSNHDNVQYVSPLFITSCMSLILLNTGFKLLVSLSFMVVYLLLSSNNIYVNYIFDCVI